MDMEYKKKFTVAEMRALADWYQRHAAELPETLQLDAATFYTDLRFTLDGFFKVYGLHGEKPSFSGEIYQLFLIKKRLVELGMPDD